MNQLRRKAELRHFHATTYSLLAPLPKLLIRPEMRNIYQHSFNTIRGRGRVRVGLCGWFCRIGIYTPMYINSIKYMNFVKQYCDRTEVSARSHIWFKRRSRVCFLLARLRHRLDPGYRRHWPPAHRRLCLTPAHRLHCESGRKCRQWGSGLIDLCS